MTKDKIANEAQEQLGNAVAWVGDVATKVAESAAGLADNIDVESAQKTVSKAASTAVEKAAALAPVVVTAKKRPWKRGSLLGIAAAAAIAYFFHPDKGEDRRTRVAAKASSLVSSATETVTQKFKKDSEQPTANAA